MRLKVKPDCREKVMPALRSFLVKVSTLPGALGEVAG